MLLELKNLIIFAKEKAMLDFDICFNQSNNSHSSLNACLMLRNSELKALKTVLTGKQNQTLHRVFS